MSISGGVTSIPPVVLHLEDLYEGSARVEAKDAYEAELAGMVKAISAVVCLAHRIYRFCDAAILR